MEPVRGQQNLLLRALLDSRLEPLSAFHEPDTPELAGIGPSPRTRSMPRLGGNGREASKRHAR